MASVQPGYLEDAIRDAESVVGVSNYRSMSALAECVRANAHVAHQAIMWGGVAPGAKHVQRAEACNAASSALTMLAKAMDTAGEIVRQHADWFDGTCKYDLRIIDMRLSPTGICKVALEARNDAEVRLLRIDKDGHRWSLVEEYGPGSTRVIGRSQLDVLDALGVAQSYIDGLISACEFLHQEDGFFSKVRRDIKLSCDIALQQTLAEFAIKLERSDVSLSDIRALRKHLHRVLRKLNDGAGEFEGFAMPPQDVAYSQTQSLQLAASFIDLPAVPTEQHAVAEVRRMRPFSGLYFYRIESAIAYVGMSANVPQRLSAHDRVPCDGVVSVLEMPASEAVWLEKVYIGVLRPSLNGEANIAAKYQ